MTLTITNRIEEYNQRKIARQRMRSTDRREYVHFCSATFDGSLAVGTGCGQTINTSMADDFVAHCPNCSKHDDDYRVFRFYGDVNEYERAGRVDWLGGIIALVFAALSAAILVVALFL